MRECPCGCTRMCRVGLSRAATTYERLEAAVGRLVPTLSAAREDPTVDGDFRTIVCRRWNRVETLRASLLAHLHDEPTSTTQPLREATRQAAELVSTIDRMLDSGGMPLSSRPAPDRHP